MILFYFFLFTTSIQYSVLNNELTISGSGTVTQFGVRSKGDYTKLTKVIIEEGPEAIEAHSFLLCTSLVSIEISKTVTSITSPFYGCSKLSSIIVDPENPNYVSDEEGFLYSKNYEDLYRAPCRKSLSIREGVKTLKHYSFAMARKYSYTDITFPNSLENIEDVPFYGFNTGKFLFRETPLLESMKGFGYCSISTLTIPKSCIYLSKEGFDHTTIGEIVFQETSSLEIVESKAFQASNVKSINFPESLLTVEDYAFYQCNTLTDVSFGSQISSLSSTAFTGCINLVNVTISSSNSYYMSTGTMLMTKDETEILFIVPGQTQINIIPTVSKVGLTLLQSQTSLTTINVDPNNLHYV